LYHRAETGTLPLSQRGVGPSTPVLSASLHRYGQGATRTYASLEPLSAAHLLAWWSRGCPFRGQTSLARYTLCRDR
jgi:hypothetical protein